MRVREGEAGEYSLRTQEGVRAHDIIIYAWTSVKGVPWRESRQTMLTGTVLAFTPMFDTKRGINNSITIGCLNHRVMYPPSLSCDTLRKPASRAMEVPHTLPYSNHS